MNAAFRCLAIGTVCALIWSAGCGGAEGDADRLPTVPVSGTVTYNGTAVADASVSLIPDLPPGTPPTEASNRKGAFARTDSAGKFNLMTYEEGDGAVPGKYKVTVTKVEGQPIGVEASEEEYAETPEGEEPPPPKPLLPEKYSNARTTPLDANIAEGDPVTLDLQLKD